MSANIRPLINFGDYDFDNLSILQGEQVLNDNRPFDVNNYNVDGLTILTDSEQERLAQSNQAIINKIKGTNV